MNLALGFDSRCHSYDETTCLGCTDLLQYSFIFDEADSYTNRTIINLQMCGVVGGGAAGAHTGTGSRE